MKKKWDHREITRSMPREMDRGKNGRGKVGQRQKGQDKDEGDKGRENG